ncbi:hypothetical protein BDV29DRAFT_156879 [Aspergillus leporis]|uniref:Uncharacterized protein n=1 Tax=Aspergillus leporis TaxID=41062 RepID=A0A5N5X0L5_9EURO|nr:hypothetical protein BDV29DRAFT_156879 [Aspergillus leporis]
MIPILKVLGATDEDLEKMKGVSNDLLQVRRLEFQPFALSVEEGFVRRDSVLIRKFREVDESLQENTVLHALLVFKVLIFHGVSFKHRPRLDSES